VASAAATVIDEASRPRSDMRMSDPFVMMREIPAAVTSLAPTAPGCGELQLDDAAGKPSEPGWAS
jgi:hypothetical protein